VVEGTHSTPPVAATPSALVTGAAGHVGGALLRLLGAAGYTRIGVDRPGTEPAAGAPAASDIWLTVDLAEPTSQQVLTEGLREVPRLDLVVAAAGVTALGSLDRSDDAVFRQVMDVNYHGALRTARAALPALRAARGHLVVVSSVAGFLPIAGRPAYVGAKHAVTGAFLALADELAPDGVTVTVVHPPFLATTVTDVGAAPPRTTTGATLDADDLARALVRMAARRRQGTRVPTRMVVGRTAYLADVASRLAPALARRLAARQLRDG
jgi:NAD(P)-dependent dehydrogenase (short-subunit alcohol dehydrogenase family)